MPADDLPPLDFLLADAQVGEAPDPGVLPRSDPRTPGTLVGRGITAVPPPVVQVITDQFGNGFPLDLSQVSKDAVARARATAPAYPNAGDGAVAVMHALASGQRRAPAAPRPPVPATTTLRPGGGPAAAQRARAVPVVGRPEPVPAGEPEAGPEGGYVEQGPRRSGPNLPAAPLAGAPPAPGTRVTFEVPNFGPLELRFNNVIRTGEHLVLVLDARHPGPGFPRHGDATLGVDVAGAPHVFAARTTGIEFTVDRSRVCVLQVVEEAPRADYAAAQARGRMVLPPFPEDADGEAGGDRAGHDAAGAGYGYGGHDAVPGM